MAKNTMKLVVAAAVVGGAALYAVKSAKAKTSAKAIADHGTPDQINPSTGTPVPGLLPAGRHHSAMSEQLKKRVQSALVALKIHPSTGKPLAVGTPAAIAEATTVIGQLEAEGFYDTARQMRGFVNLAQKFTPTPQDPAIAQVIPPGLSASQRDYIMRVLKLERSPRVLQTFKGWLQTLPASAERDSMVKMTEALIVQVQAAVSTASSLDAVAAVIRAQSEGALNTVMSNAAGSAPKPVPVVVPARPQVLVQPSQDKILTQFDVPPYVPPAAVVPAPTALPEQPAVVPPVPVPRPVPKPLTTTQIAARAMFADIKRVQGLHGGPTTAAKRAFSSALARKFQKLSGGGVDGKPGPATYLRAAALGAVDMPLVMYWPRNNARAKVTTYRTKLRQLAAIFANSGRTADANRLRMSAEHERGQGGIPGGPLPA